MKQGGQKAQYQGAGVCYLTNVIAISEWSTWKQWK